MKLTKDKIKKIFNDKELVFLIDKYISEWNNPLPEYIIDNRTLHDDVLEYFNCEEDEILSYIDDIEEYDANEWDIHSSYYDFCDFLMDLKEHYKNNSDMEW